LVVSGALKHDVKLLEPAQDYIVVKGPEGKKTPPNIICVRTKGMQVSPLGKPLRVGTRYPMSSKEVNKRNPAYKARPWVVERALSWLNRIRELLVRFEKKVSSH
jgi:putative transposase